MPIQKNKISYTLDLTEELENVTNKQETKEQIALSVLSAIAGDLDATKSSVTGGKFQPLSKEYKAKKRKEVGSSKANLQLFGDMVNDLDFAISGNKITWKITNSTQKKKAFNHNTGDTLPQRSFLPNDNGSAQDLPKGNSNNDTASFRTGINRMIRGIIASNSENEPES